MDQRAHKVVIDAAEFDVTIGWSTGVGIVLLRCLVLSGFFFSPAPLDLWLLTQVGLQLTLAAWFTYAVYRRRSWGAIGLLVVWGIGFFYSWYAIGRVIPPLGLLGFLVWYGLYRGARGTRVLAKQTAIAAAAV